jgi:hypothetical protein
LLLPDLLLLLLYHLFALMQTNLLVIAEEAFGNSLSLPKMLL